jgi:hypothetical protein
MKRWAPKVLALDLEGTLISNAMSQIPRPGLFEFLSRCREMFPRVVMFTTIEEEKFREIARLLVQEGAAPSWFADIEYVTWHGKTKDLSFIPGIHPDEALLVDDYERYVHPGQESQWLQVRYFEHPYPESDMGLSEVLKVLHGHASKT